MGRNLTWPFRDDAYTNNFEKVVLITNDNLSWIDINKMEIPDFRLIINIRNRKSTAIELHSSKGDRLSQGKTILVITLLSAVCWLALIGLVLWVIIPTLPN